MPRTTSVQRLAVLAALLAAGCGGPADSATPAAARIRTVPVRTATVAAQDLDDTVELTGTLRPRGQVQVVSEVGARLLRVSAEEGARIRKGAVLAVLDTTDFRLSHERARAAVRVAEANLAHAEAEKQRADNLLKTGGITDKDHLSAQVNVQVTSAGLAQSRAEASIAAQQVSRTELRAPFSGRVAKRHADPGTFLAAGTPVFTVVDDSVLEFRSAVPSASYARVRVGATVDVTVDAVPGRTIAGRVVRISPMVEERSRSFEAVVEVPGNEELVGGLFARAAVRAGQVKGALVVPPAALIRDGADPRAADAFVVTAGKVERRTVAVGVETPGAIQVTAGLKAGDVVVVDPPASLASGAAVEAVAARK